MMPVTGCACGPSAMTECTHAGATEQLPLASLLRSNLPRSAANSAIRGRGTAHLVIVLRGSIDTNRERSRATGDHPAGNEEPVALIRPFRHTVRNRARQDAAFRKRLAREAINCLLAGDFAAGKTILLAHYFNAVRARLIKALRARLHHGAVAAAVGLAAGAIPGVAIAQTADAIVARVVVARGGASRLRALHSLRLTGRVTFGPTASGPLLVEQRRPDTIREELTLQDKTIVRGYDGHAGWTIDPFGSPPGLRALTGDDLKNIAAEAAFEPLVTPLGAGDHVELVGRDTVAGAPVYKLRVTLARTGYGDYYYVDSASALPVKWEGTRPINGAPVVFQSYYRDYILVDGLRFPRVIDSGSPGSTNRQQLTFDHIEVNPTESDSRFAMPPAGAAPPTDSSARAH
jgi:hypothetical protein